MPISLLAVDRIKPPYSNRGVTFRKVVKSTKGADISTMILSKFVTSCGCELEKGSWLLACCPHGRWFIQTPEGGVKNVSREVKWRRNQDGTEKLVTPLSELHRLMPERKDR